MNGDGTEGSSQFRSVSGCADALWVWQLIALQQSEVEISRMPWTSLLPTSTITAVTLSIRHGGPSEPTGSMAGVGNVITFLGRHLTHLAGYVERALPLRIKWQTEKRSS